MNSEITAHSSEHSIEQLFSVFSHELRTPITCLQGAIELLQTYQQTHPQSNPTELQNLLTLAAESTDRLTHVIENILDWYELTQGTKRLFPQLCDISLLLQQVVTTLRPLAADRQIAITLNIPASLPVPADHYYLNRTFSHLIHNAIKFSAPNSQVDIVATLVQTQDPSSHLALPYVLITIQDQGIGIPESDLDSIFRPFHQVDASDDRCHSGLGLELAICHEVIRHHYGKVWVESQLGQGSTFYIALPSSESTLHQIRFSPAD